MHQVVLEGEVVNLKPYSPSDREKVIELRNTARGQYFLNQGFVSTIETQVEWEKGYFSRDNDFYWIIECKETKEMIGTTALYDITDQDAEKGRLIVDEKKSMRKPYVLEAELLILKYAFENLKLRHLITRTKLDNDKMKSINIRFGFKKTGECIINQEVYEHFLLEDYHPDSLLKYQSIVTKWRKKEEKK
ncbi:GNAT family N-acetyltransferase [Sporosarcina sp. FSL K6-2383]|uniref:GNAT family N-acetyltransferase n=1 Tax=Sporosarcina sp. FSL K6-2383 TaxID=2921556 RepID=UPI00315A3256